MAKRTGLRSALANTLPENGGKLSCDTKPSGARRKKLSNDGENMRQPKKARLGQKQADPLTNEFMQIRGAEAVNGSLTRSELMSQYADDLFSQILKHKSELRTVANDNLPKAASADLASNRSSSLLHFLNRTSMGLKSKINLKRVYIIYKYNHDNKKQAS